MITNDYLNLMIRLSLFTYIDSQHSTQYIYGWVSGQSFIHKESYRLWAQSLLLIATK